MWRSWGGSLLRVSGRSAGRTLRTTEGDSPRSHSRGGLCGESAVVGKRQACGKVPAPLRSVNRSVRCLQRKTQCRTASGVKAVGLPQRLCTLCTVFHTPATPGAPPGSATTRWPKFAEALLDLPLGQLEEDPGGHPVLLRPHEVQPPAHCP